MKIARMSVEVKLKIARMSVGEFIILSLTSLVSFSFGNTFPLGNIGQRRPLRGQGQLGVKPGQPQWAFNGCPAVGVVAQPPPGNILYRNNSLTTTAFPPRPHIFDVNVSTTFS